MTRASVCQLYYLLLVTGIILNVSSQVKVVAADTHSTAIKFLPGFPGPLPFRLETGYVGVDESEDVQLFYYFVESETNPKEDPIILWMAGGPGCSSFSGLATGVGPIYFKEVVYDGTLPTLFLNTDAWTKDKQIKDVRAYHANLSMKGVRSLIYSGDNDWLVPFQSTQAWIRDLNYSIVDDWRPWLVEDQIAGYARTYSNKMTFATVKGGSHTPPENRPAECHAMFERWVSEKPL